MKNIIFVSILLIITVISSGCITGSTTIEINKAKEGNTVSVDYWLTVDGKLIDTSEGRQPYTFKIGAPGTLQGFQDAVKGMRIGETKEFTIPAGKGYPSDYSDKKVAGKELHFKIILRSIDS